MRIPPVYYFHADGSTCDHDASCEDRVYARIGRAVTKASGTPQVIDPRSPDPDLPEAVRTLPVGG